MKKFYSLIGFIPFLLLFSFVNSLAQAPSDLFISEYVEGSSNNKALEFYNGTGAAIDLTAGNYVVQMYFNGGTAASTVINLTGTVANGAVFVLANSAASFAGAPYVNQVSSFSFYNGDDAIVLRKGGTAGTVVDVIGQVGFDPGTEWGSGSTSTSDNTIRRKQNICTGDVNTSDAFDPSVEWDGFAMDDFTGLGNHTSTCAVSSGITVSPLTLSFTTTVGIPAAAQSYTVTGNELTEDIAVAVPAPFGIALTAGGPYSNNLTIAAADVNAAPVTVYVLYNALIPGTQTESISHVSGSSSAGVVVSGTAIANTTTYIYSIQGTTDISPYDGNIVNTEGIVTGVFQNAGQLGGYYIQDTTGDGDALTSDGLFIYDTIFKVAVGDYVKITGTVDEYFNKTEIKDVSAATITSSGNALPLAVNINLPVAAISDLEKYEGMYVQFGQTLTVSETYNLGRYGELLLSSGGRLMNPTNFIDPNDDPASGTSSSGNSNVAAVSAQQELNTRNSILLDDGSNIQNPAVVPFLNPADTTLRSGSTTTGLTGNLDFSFGTYLVEPTQAPVFDYAARPLPPDVGSANVKISSFNVLNYFNGDGTGGGFPTSRGADNLPEFNRQRSKVISALKNLNADVVGLTEIENDGDGALSAIADLVNGLNDSTAAGTYAYVLDPTGADGNTGTDAIKVAIIYKPAVVTPVGLAKADINPVNNRPPVAQTFALNTNGEKFSVIINHLKSKSCDGASGANTDQGDGQGCYNNQRKLQAEALLEFIDSVKAWSGNGDIVSVGDYNAYGEEDPLDILRAGGLTKLLPGSHSYVFDGQAGALDHAFVSAAAFSKITGAAEWHINADEPLAKDYNQEFNQPYLYSPGPYRSSDHDPVLVGLNLQPCKTDTSITAIAACSGNLPYLWNGNAYDTAGTYYYDTTNAAGCDSVATLVLTIKQGPAIASISTSPISCYGGTTFLTVNATGGTKPYTYSINGSRFVRTNNINNIKAGTYNIIIADAGGCTTDTTITIAQPPILKLRVAASAPSCNGGTDGGIRATGSGGTVPYQYKLDDGSYGSNNVFTGLSAGVHTVSIKDANGCANTVVVNIPQGKGNCANSIAANKGNGKATATAMLNVVVLPNPTADYFTVNVSSTTNNKIQLFVTDMAGRRIYSASSTENNSFRFGSNFSAGTYILTIVQGEEKKVLKLVKSN